MYSPARFSLEIGVDCGRRQVENGDDRDARRENDMMRTNNEHERVGYQTWSIGGESPRFRVPRVLHQREILLRRAFRDPCVCRLSKTINTIVEMVLVERKLWLDAQRSAVVPPRTPVRSARGLAIFELYNYARGKNKVGFCVAPDKGCKVTKRGPFPNWDTKLMHCQRPKRLLTTNGLDNSLEWMYPSM